MAKTKKICSSCENVTIEEYQTIHMKTRTLQA
jgi:hypothetical protein